MIQMSRILIMNLYLKADLAQIMIEIQTNQKTHMINRQIQS
jgi:hypothetical protein